MMFISGSKIEITPEMIEAEVDATCGCRKLSPQVQKCLG
jgi:hypothetical protein